MRLARVTAGLGLALASCAVCAAPAPAFEQGSWLAPADLSAPGSNFSPPRVAVASDGTMAAAWARSDGITNRLYALARQPGGDLPDATVVSGDDAGVSFPDLAIGADGTAIAVWTAPAPDPLAALVRASLRPPGGAFGAPVTVATVGLTGIPRVAVGPDGTAIVVWAQSDGSNDLVQASVRPPGGPFAPPVALSGSGQDAQTPQVSFAADGTAIAAWTRSDGANAIAQASIRPAGGPFGAPVDLSTTGQNASLGSPVAFAADGTATVVWTRGGVVQAATRAPGGAFGAPVDLSAGDGQIVDAARIAVGGEGTATAVWTLRRPSESSVVQAITRPAGGAFAAPIDLTATGSDAHSPQVAMSADGTTTAVWRRPGGGGSELVHASTRPPGGAFAAAVPLSAEGKNAFDPFVTMASSGYATVLWNHSDGTNSVVQAAFTADVPIARGVPLITGTPTPGAALGCDGGRWVGATSVETRWLRGAAEVATGTGYTVDAADQGSDLTCRAKAINALGSTERSSLPFSIPAPAPPLPPEPGPGLAPPPPPPPAPALAPPADLNAPHVAVLTKTRLTRRQFLAGVSVKLSADEPATIVAALRGRASRSRTTGPYTRPLGSRTVFGVTRKTLTIKVKPRLAAVGRARSFPVRLRLTVTDALGNRRITGKTIRIAG